MKLKHTQARKARRASAFHSTGAHDLNGCNPFGVPVYKTIQHAEV